MRVSMLLFPLSEDEVLGPGPAWLQVSNRSCDRKANDTKVGCERLVVRVCTLSDGRLTPSESDMSCTPASARSD